MNTREAIEALIFVAIIAIGAMIVAYIEGWFEKRNDQS